MNTIKSCQICGTQLSVGTDFAFCPKCLAREAQRHANVDSGLAETEASSTSHFVPPSPEELDKLLSGFEIVELIGVGGMGAV